MEGTFKVKALGSGFGGHIATVEAWVEYNSDTMTMEDFYKKSCSAIFQQGYNVLHFESINDLKYSKVLFCMYKEEKLCLYILQKCKEYKVFDTYQKKIEEVKNKNTQIDDVRVSKFDGQYYCGCWSEKRIEEEKNKITVQIQGVYTTLNLLGVDVDDNETKKRILTNLGFYRI